MLSQTSDAQEPTYVPHLLDVLLPFNTMLVEGADYGTSRIRFVNCNLVSDFCYAPTVFTVSAYLSSNPQVRGCCACMHIWLKLTGQHRSHGSMAADAGWP